MLSSPLYCGLGCWLPINNTKIYVSWHYLKTDKQGQQSFWLCVCVYVCISSMSLQNSFLLLKHFSFQLTLRASYSARLLSSKAFQLVASPQGPLVLGTHGGWWTPPMYLQRRFRALSLKWKGLGLAGGYGFKGPWWKSKESMRADVREGHCVPCWGIFTIS